MEGLALSCNNYRIPPPNIKRNKPKNIATTQIIIPPLDFPKIESTKPKIANGILNQFNHPNNGIIPSNIPKMARIPNKRPRVFIKIDYKF